MLVSCLGICADCFMYSTKKIDKKSDSDILKLTNSLLAVF